jgi:hypothetical protein
VPSAACPFSVPCLLFMVFWQGSGVSLSIGLCWFILGWLWEYHLRLGAHLLVCQMSPKQVWS